VFSKYTYPTHVTVCQTGAGSVKMGGQTWVSKLVQDVLESALQQSLVNTASASSSATDDNPVYVTSAQLCLRTQYLCVVTYNAHTLLYGHIAAMSLESFQWTMQVMRHKKRVHGTYGNQLTVRTSVTYISICNLVTIHLCYVSNDTYFKLYFFEVLELNFKVKNVKNVYRSAWKPIFKLKSITSIELHHAFCFSTHMNPSWSGRHLIYLLWMGRRFCFNLGG